jgi:hypothetical protein
MIQRGLGITMRIPGGTAGVEEAMAAMAAARNVAAAARNGGSPRRPGSKFLSLGYRSSNRFLGGKWFQR